MYGPVKNFFENQGHIVKAEVRSCDMVLVKGDEIAVVELKKSFNMTLIYQILERKKIANLVYIAIPRSVFTKNRHHILYILERLEIGLICVAMDSPVKTVEVLLLAKAQKSRSNRNSRALLAEFNGRTFDGNIGGSSGKKIITAHRERVLKIACALEKTGHARVSVLIKKYGCHKYTGQDLRRDVYGWFTKISKGIYALSEKGQLALKEPAFNQIVEYYRANIESEEIDV